MEDSQDDLSEVREIPIEITNGKLVILENRLDDGAKRELFGMLANPPIEIGKFINLSRCNTSPVVSIWMEGDIYIIETEEGSKYKLDPRDLPDINLKPEDNRFMN